MKITFSDIRDLATAIERNDDGKICDFFNRFEGDNVYFKFKNFLKCWELDVSPNLDFVIDKDNFKIMISFFLDSFPYDLGGKVNLKENDFECSIAVPREFTYDEKIPIYSIMSSLQAFGQGLDFKNFEEDDRKNIIDNLPPHIYNLIIKGILNDREKTVQFIHPRLSGFQLNFWTNEPFIFLKSLIHPYNTMYFRDVIFNLSKRIDSTILMNSTISDIEYFIQRFNEEMKESNSSPPSL